MDPLEKLVAWLVAGTVVILAALGGHFGLEATRAVNDRVHERVAACQSIDNEASRDACLTVAAK